MAYLSLNEYCRRVFGEKLYRLSVSAGCTCPNRDGAKGVGGCVFCSPAGAGEFSQCPGPGVTLQLELAKKRVEGKFRGNAYIAYFQDHSNTYGDPERLSALWREAADFPGVRVLDVATRPDCLPPEILSALAAMRERLPVWTELGLQTSNEDTARRMNRCFANADFLKAVADLHSIGSQAIAHLIFGLPGETREDMLESVRFACGAGIDGLKIHCLYVQKGSALAEMYERGEFRCLEKDEYIGLLRSALELVPESVVIHRLTGDGDKRTLIAPDWTRNKKDVLNSLKMALG